MNAAANASLAAEVARLREAVAALERRVVDLESDLLPGDGYEPDVDVADSEVPDLRPTATRGLFLLGRSVIVLAGAFLLRTLTEAGTLPPVAGFAAASLFALTLVALADRAAGRGDRTGAGAYGLTAALVGYPLLLETTGISSLVPAGGGAAVLVLITVAGLLVAARTRLRLLAWAYTLATLATTVVLMFALDAEVLFTAVLLVLGIGTLLLAYTRGWRLERWLPALVADALILRMVVMAADRSDPGPDAVRPEPGAVLGLALALLVIYLGIFTFRTLIQGKGARVFYVVQSTAALLIGYGGAVRVAQSGGGAGGAVLGWLALLAAAGYYTVAFAVVRQRHGRGQGFFYFASLGLVLLVLGSRVVTPGGLLAWIWILLGAAMAALGARFDRTTLRAHGATYLALAAVPAGLVAVAWDAFAGGAGATWHPLRPAAIAVLVTALGSWFLAVSTRREADPGAWRRVPGFGALLTGLVGLGTVVITTTVALLGPAPPAASPATVAVVRTAVLALTVVVLAWQARHPSRRELSWPVYPLLAIGLAKLLAEDLRQGTPLTLTVAFTLFGAALILAPRLLHRDRAAAASSVGDANAG